MERLIRQGCVDILIDDLVPCLVDTVSGEVKETVVFKIESRSFLKKFTEKNGWHISWYRMPKEVHIFALALKDTMEIQGLVGLRDDVEANAIYIHWMCTAPHNNIHDFGTQKYSGVGGHLFAIVADTSIKWGHGGAMHGFAANVDLLKHYMEKLGAHYLGMQHKYQFFIDESQAEKILEVYSYEWNDID